MKNGYFFFLNFGNITMVARLVLILSIVGMIYFSPGDFMFWACMAICALSIVFSIIPAPKDRHVMYAMRFFYEDFEKVLNTRFDVMNMEKLALVKGYKKNGRMLMKRYIDKKAVYPYPVVFASNRVHNDSFVYIGEMTLLSKKEPIYTKCNTKDEGFSISWETDPDNERVAYVTVTCEKYPEGITMIAENDFHFRALIDTASGK